MAVLDPVIAARADATSEERRRAYNGRLARRARVSRSSIVRAVHRAGYVLKKTPGPSDVARPDVHATRPTFLRWQRRVDATRLVVRDEAGANLAMGRSHVRRLIRAWGATVHYLPPYSPDFSPIEPAWGLVTRDIRKHAPRTAHALRRVAQRARHVVRPGHCRQWLMHAGYQLK